VVDLVGIRKCKIMDRLLIQTDCHLDGLVQIITHDTIPIQKSIDLRDGTPRSKIKAQM
jgi:hypothetical protein